MTGESTRGLVVVFDDLRVPLFDFDVIARSSAAAVDFLEACVCSDDDVVIDQLWLDHDLGGDDTVKPALELLESLGAARMGNWISQVLVHTQNPIAAEQMVRGLAAYGYRVRRVDPAKFFVVQ